jgi:hypothetical protein
VWSLGSSAQRRANPQRHWPRYSRRVESTQSQAEGAGGSLTAVSGLLRQEEAASNPFSNTPLVDMRRRSSFVAQVDAGRGVSTGQGCAKRTAEGGVALTRAERCGSARRHDPAHGGQIADVSSASSGEPVGSGPSWKSARGEPIAVQRPRRPAQLSALPRAGPTGAPSFE